MLNAERINQPDVASLPGLFRSLRAMNKMIIITLFSLLTEPSVFADTKWETYLGNPTPENAARVEGMEYTPGKIPEKYGYWAPDLIILQDQILGGDSEAFRLAYRLREKAGGGLLEELTIVLGHVIRARPELFLREMSALRPSKATLESILSMPGEEYVDREEAKKYEIKMRRQALASVQSKNLQEFRDLCVGLIDKAVNKPVSSPHAQQNRWIRVDGGKWDPSPKMLSDLKTKIEFYVGSQAKAQERELQKWKAYTFQYQGQEDGKKYIFVNALCDQGMRTKDLSEEIVHIFDGGSCYFSLKYDPERNDFFDLFINGES